MNISLKIVLKTSFFLFFVILNTLIFYSTLILIDGDNRTVEAWYNSGWFYRRPITVSNPTGSTITDAEVLIVIDTEALTTTKLRSDCGDLRFVDSDDSTLLTYWIEGGCDTTTTQVWVRIPSLPAGGKTIYVYYGNPAATSVEASWTGKFIVLSTAACPAGWTRESAIDNRFPYGSSTYGSTNTVSSSHTHSNFDCTTGGPTTVTVQTFSEEDPPASISRTTTGTHTHTITGATFGSADSTPPYVGMYFCSYNKLLYTTSMVAISRSLDSGWQTFTTLTSKFPRGASSYTGTALGSLTHQHTVSAGTSSSVGDLGDPIIGGTPRVSISKTHTHASASGTTPTVTNQNLPSYITVIYENYSQTTPATQNHIAMVSSIPPIGWEQNTSFNSRFPYGGASYGTMSGNTAHTHNTTITTSAGPYSANVENLGTPTTSRAAGGHVHSCTVTSSSVSLIPEYFTVPFANRKISQNTSLGSEELYAKAPNAPSSLETEDSTNPVGVTDTTPEFSSIHTDDNGDDAMYYEIEVNTNNTFSGTVMWDSGKVLLSPTVDHNTRGPLISYGATALSLNGTTYYWRMKYWDVGDLESAWSSVAQFTMNTAPSAPTNPKVEDTLSPVVGVTDLTPEFKATHNDPNSDDAKYYEIEVNTNNTFSGTVMWDTGQVLLGSTLDSGTESLEVSYSSATTLSLNGTTYYWRIRFTDIYDTVGAWSSVAQFTMNTAPSAPTSLTTETLTNPLNVSDLTPEFSSLFQDPNTGDTGKYYQIQVNTNNTFDGTTMWDSGQILLTPTIAINARSPEIPYSSATVLSADGSLYYVRMKYWDNYDTAGAWSTVGSFRMQRQPSSPTSLLVDGNSNPTAITSLTPTFSAIYNDVNEHSATAYEIEVNSNNTFTGTVMWDTDKLSTSITEGERSSNFTYAGTALSDSKTTYYWRIRFWDTDDLQGDWSEVGTFVDNMNHQYFKGLQLKGLQLK